MSGTNPNASREIDKALEALTGFQHKYCIHLRTLINKALPEVKEDWRAKIIFNVNGSVCGISSSKNDVKLTFFKGSEMKDPYGFFDAGEGIGGNRSIKFTQDSVIDDPKITEYLQEAAAMNKLEEKTDKKLIEIPADLLRALGVSSGLKMYFERLPPSHKREYMDYIADAKGDDTRERRIKKIIEMVTESKKLHEKYGNRRK